MQKSDPVLSLSPSFKAYSSANFSSEDEISRPNPHDTVDDGDDDDGDFEFPFPCRPVDHIFPVFNRQLLSPDAQENDVDGAASHLQLLIKDRDPPSSSSSEEDELERIPDGTYCVWTGPSGSSARCEKSSSTGSSRRFRFRDLLHRSHSDGKERFVFLRPEKRGEKAAEKRRSSCDGKGKGKEKENVKGGEKERREMRYVKNCAVDRRRTFLPYKQRLVDFGFGFGFFSFTNPPSRF